MAIELDWRNHAPRIALTILCDTWAEAMATCQAVEAISPAAFAPALAISDGFPATGASTATHVEDAPEAPPLDPATEALIERAESAESATDGLKAGEAYQPEMPAVHWEGR